MSKKILVTLVSVLLIAFMLNACGMPAAQSGSSAVATTAPDQQSKAQNTGTESKKTILGVVNVNAVYTYFQAEIKGMQEQAKKENVELVVLDSQGDAGKEISNVESLITQKVNAILLISVGETDGGQCVKTAQAANIPIIAVSRKISGSKPSCSVITGPDHAQAGADYFVSKMMNGKGKIAEIQGMPGDGNEILRADALKNALAKYPDIKLLTSIAANYDPAKANAAASDILSKYPDVEAFYVHNDGMAQGVIKAVKDANKTGKIKIYAIDGEQTAIASIKAGEQTATNGAPVGLEGARAVHAAVKIIKGEKVDEFYYTPSIVIDQSNVDKFMGSSFWEKIDWSEYPIK